MNKNKWIRVYTGAEYSANFDFFSEYQIACWKTFAGNAVTSLIENRIFYRNKKRNMTDDERWRILRQIHRKICSLNYGGRIVE